MTRDNIVYLDQPRDYPERFVRPIEPAQIARILGEPVDLYDQLGSQSQSYTIYKRQLRNKRWQSRVSIACCVLAVLTVMYFAFEMGRVWL